MKVKENFIFNTIKSKISFAVIVLIVVVITFFIAYSTAINKQEEIVNIKQYSLNLSKNYAKEISSEFDLANQTLNSLALFFSSLKNSDINSKLDRNDANTILQNALINKDKILSAYMIWEPNAFDNKDSIYMNDIYHDETGEFSSYFYREKKNIFVQKKITHYKEKESYKFFKVNFIDKQIYFTCNKNGDSTIINISLPITDNDNFYGVVGIELKTKWLQKFVKNIDIYKNKAHISIINNSGFIIADSKYPKRIDKHIRKFYNNFSTNLDYMNKGLIYINEYNEQLNIQYPIKIKDNNIFWAINVQLPINKIAVKYHENMWSLIIMSLLFIIISLFISNNLVSTLLKPLHDISQLVYDLSLGKLNLDFNIKSTGEELQDIIYAFNKLTEGLKKTASFAKEIGKENFDKDFIPLSMDDVLGNALLGMKKSLKKSKEEEELRKKEKEKEEWITTGITKFSDILRLYSNNIESLSYTIIKNLVYFLRANQGGIYIYNDENQDGVYLEQTACFAYDRKKYNKKKIAYGEGLIGICAIEKETIYLDELPDEYIEIESGLGDSNPSYLLLMPLNLEDKVLGVIELASFSSFEEYQINFIKEVAEDIASTISIMKINNKTTQLLKITQAQKEEMLMKEEEMRQNMEELRVTQEVSFKKSKEMSEIIRALDEACCVAEFDIKGKTLNINQKFADVLSSDIDYLEGKNHKNFANVSSEKEYPNGYLYFWNNLKQGIIQRKKFHIFIDGSETILNEIYTPILDDNDKIFKILLIAFEIEN